MEVIRTEVTIAVAEYIRDYHDVERVQGYCAQCNSYGRVWGCPPFDFDVDAYLAPYTTVRIFASQIIYGAIEQARFEQAGGTADAARRVVERATDALWRIELPRLYDLERNNPGSLICTCRCRLCRPEPCARETQQPCRHPDKQRHSLESLGFDLEATSRELLHITLQWAKPGQLPKYTTIITAHFTP